MSNICADCPEEHCDIREENQKLEDVYDSGFAAGVHFSFFMLRNVIKKYMTNKDIIKLANWFELKNPWYNFDKWYDLMIRALCLDEGDFRNKVEDSNE